MKQGRINLQAAWLAAMVFCALLWAGPAQAQEEKAALYERLGGTYAIATVVDEFIERLLVNSTLNANPAISEARGRVPKAGLKFRVTAMMAQATGGPEVYTGRSMPESHAHLNINEREWQAMMADLDAVLYKFNVPDAERQEVLALVETLKPDIVVGSSD
jgi:hemoglobin